jgi:hypothetical protein
VKSKKTSLFKQGVSKENGRERKVIASAISLCFERRAILGKGGFAWFFFIAGILVLLLRLNKTGFSHYFDTSF